MANDIQLKRSSVAGKIPDSANVLVGEPVVNLYDKKVYTKDGSGNIVQIAAGNLQALADVSNTTPSLNQVLTWNGSVWAPEDATASTGGVSSVGGLTGNISNAQLAAGIVTSGLLTTANVVELTNLYFTNARAVDAVTHATLSNITVSGNITTSGNISGQYIYGDATYMTGLAPALQVYRFANVASTISTYYEATSLAVFTSNTTHSITQTVTQTPTLLGSFATKTGYPNLTVVPAGTFTIRYETQKASGNKAYSTYAEVYHRTSGGTEDLISTSDVSSSTVLNSTVQNQVYAVLTTDHTLDISDRIVIKVYAQLLVNGSDSISLNIDDNTNSGFDMPVLPASINNFVPYLNATRDLNLGNFAVIADHLTGNVYGRANTAGLADSAVISNSANSVTAANVIGLTTANVTELTNLYYTNTRVYANVTQLGYATTGYVGSQGFITASALTGYATESYVASQGYITISALSGYATESYVNSQGFITASNLSGYATNAQLATYATNSQLSVYATNSQLSSYALTSSLTTANVAELINLYYTDSRVYTNVVQLGYITSAALTGYARNTQLELYATNAQLALYATNSQLASYATTANLALKANIVDLTTANVTEVNNLYFTNARVYSNVTQLGYITSSALSGYATNSQLATYATNAQLASYATNAQLASYATNSQLALYATNAQLLSYATTANLALKANIVDLTTANVTEVSNLYFTNARVYANVTQLGYITSTTLTGYATNSQLATYATNAQLATYATNAQLISYATTANSLAQFASTTSAQLAGVISDETGSGSLVFATAPTLVTPTLGLATGTSVMLSANIGAASGNVSGSFTAGTFQTAGNVNAGSLLVTNGATLSGNINIAGNLNVAGAVTSYTSNTFEIADTMIYLATYNPADVQDIGFVGHFTNPGYQHTGLVRDASDGIWKLFANVQTEPSNNTLDFSTATYSPLTMGALTASTGTFSSTVSATSANVNAASGLFTGSVTGDTIQTAGNVNSQNELVSGSLTAGTIQTAGNVNTGNLRVVTNSSVGTVVSGTWNGSSISTTYTDAKVTSVNGQVGAATGFATTANSLAQFASTTSAQLLGVISDETGSGSLVFATTPTLVTPILGLATGTSVMLSANIGAAAGNVSGNFTAGNFQTSGAVTSVSATATANITADKFLATNNGNSENYRVGDDAWIGDYNVANAFKIKGVQDATQAYISFGSSDGATLGRSGLGALTYTAGFAAANVVSTGNISAGNAAITNSLTAGTLQTAGNVNSASELITGSLTAGTLQTAGNVNASSLRVTTASSLGTVQSGTWNGSSISTTYTDAKVTSVSNTAPISITTTTGAVTVGMLASGVSATTYGNATIIPVITVDTYGRITSASNVSLSAAGAATVLFQDAAPSTPTGNTLWWQSNTGILKVYYTDADSSQWVDASPTVPGASTSLSDDTSTNSTYYPIFATAVTGSLSSAKASSTKLTYNPSTGTLSATTFSGAGTLTSLVASGGTAATTTTTGTIIITGGLGLSGNVYAGGVVSGLDLLSTSDKRLKKNINTIRTPLNTVQELRGVTFQWKKSGKDSIGVIAQEVEEIIPQVVETDGDGFKTVSYGSIVGLLIEAIKEQQEQINELKRIINGD
jgi:hypothetical protein